MNRDTLVFRAFSKVRPGVLSSVCMQRCDPWGYTEYTVGQWNKGREDANGYGPLCFESFWDLKEFAFNIFNSGREELWLCKARDRLMLPPMLDLRKRPSILGGWPRGTAMYREIMPVIQIDSLEGATEFCNLDKTLVFKLFRHTPTGLESLCYAPDEERFFLTYPEGVWTRGKKPGYGPLSFKTAEDALYFSRLEGWEECQTTELWLCAVQGKFPVLPPILNRLGGPATHWWPVGTTMWEEIMPLVRVV